MIHPTTTKPFPFFHLPIFLLSCIYNLYIIKNNNKEHDGMAWHSAYMLLGKKKRKARKKIFFFSAEKRDGEKNTRMPPTKAKESEKESRKKWTFFLSILFSLRLRIMTTTMLPYQPNQRERAWAAVVRMLFMMMMMLLCSALSLPLFLFLQLCWLWCCCMGAGSFIQL